MEFYKNATELSCDVAKFLLREKNVPRKYRAVATYPIINKFDELIAQIETANRIRTDTEEHVEERKKLQAECIAKVDEIYRLLQRTVELLWKDKIRSTIPTAEQQRLRNALNDFAIRLVREEELLTGWKKSTRLNKQRTE